MSTDFKDLSVEKKLLVAKTYLMYNSPFFGALICRLPTIECTDEATSNTMATDGKSIIYWTPFVNGLTKMELVFVLVHEVMHCALDHHTRRRGRDPKKWNYAADYAINGELTDAAIGKMPEGGLLDPQYTGLSADEIYNLLPDEDDGGGGGNDPGGCGGVIDAAPEHDEAALAAASADMKVAVKQAAAIAKKHAEGQNAGAMPASMQRLIDQMLKPVVDWRAVLRRFIDENSTITDYSWTRPNRRYLPMGLVLPGVVSDGISHIAIAVDTSGSINGEVLQRFTSEINGAFGDGLIDKITVIYCDAHIHNHQTFERGDDIALDPQGGGGTRFSPAFEWLAENAPDASAIIYFTDLYCSDFGPEPACPVLWGVYGDSREFDKLVAATPFGEAVSVTH